MSNRCMGCGVDLAMAQRFRDSDGNYFCATCIGKARANRCEICGEDTIDKPSFYRSDGTFFCEKCFQLAVSEKQPASNTSTVTPEIYSQIQSKAQDNYGFGDEIKSNSPDFAIDNNVEKKQSETTTKFYAKPSGPLVELAPDADGDVHIVDPEEPTFSPASISAIFTAGIVAGMFTHSIIVFLLVVAALFITHFIFSHFMGN